MTAGVASESGCVFLCQCRRMYVLCTYYVLSMYLYVLCICIIVFLICMYSRYVGIPCVCLMFYVLRIVYFICMYVFILLCISRVQPRYDPA